MAADFRARLRTRTIVKVEPLDVKESFEERDVKPDLGRFQCDQCELRFKTKGFLSRHMQLHSVKVPYCARCGASEAGKLCKNCSRVTGNGEQHSCPTCGKCFNQKINLTCHIRVHTGERPFVCSECKAAFKQKSTLDNHSRIHTGELPFSCRECGSKFRQRSHLDNHIRLHNGERPYSCDQCEASFTQKSNLNYHVLRHSASGLRPTGRRYRRTKNFVREKRKNLHRRPSSLSNHLRVRSGDR